MFNRKDGMAQRNGRIFPCEPLRLGVLAVKQNFNRQHVIILINKETNTDITFATMKLAQRLAISYIRTKFKLLSAISKKKAAMAAVDLFRTPQIRNKKKKPPVFEKAEKLQFRLGADTIRGYRWNKGGLRKALILHGFESSVTNFDRYVKPLISKGYEVLAFDAPAHGGSSGKTITAPLYAQMIIDINKHYGPVQSYMAHSFGGLALSLAMEKIKHDNGYRLALIAPATETKTAIDSFFQFLKLDKGLRPEFDKLIYELGGHPVEWYSIPRALMNIKAHVTWFHDEEDTITPISDVIKAKEKNYPHVSFVFTSGLGHRRIYRDNKVSKAVINFL